MQKNDEDSLKEQYEKWVYPQPPTDLKKYIDGGIPYKGFPHKYYPDIWPERHSLDNKNILIAGCGTTEAALYALALPKSNIVGIDLSKKSLDICRSFVEHHKINNITLLNVSLLSVNELGMKFDHIVSSGVLHHLKDPEAGLNSLKEVLVYDGVMKIALYSSYARQGIYMLQSIFRRLRCGQSSADINLVKSTLSILPENHSFRHNVRNYKDIEYDAGLVDLLLHTQDTSYTVPLILDLLRRNDLTFSGWVEPLDYTILHLIDSKHPLYHPYIASSVEDRWIISELINQNEQMHQFYVRHNNEISHLKINFVGDKWLNYVPIFKPGLSLIQSADFSKGQPVILAREKHRFSLGYIAANLLKRVDEKNTIQDIINLTKQEINTVQVNDAKDFFEFMWTFGHLMYYLTPVDS